MQLRARAELEIRRRRAKKSETLKATLAEWKNDFPGFAKNLKVPPKEMGEPVSVVQSPILKAFEDNRTGRDYVLKARQVFMTTWELARDIWFFLVNPSAQVVVLCQSDKDNSAPKELSARIVTMLESLKERYPDAPFAKVSDTRWVRTDGAKSVLRILGAGATEKSASKKGRTGTIHRLHITEVSFFEYAYDTLTAIVACVPGRDVGSEITFESTPSGAAGYFYENYFISKSGKNGFKAHFFPWFMQPEYREKILEGETIVPETAREKEIVTLHKISPEQLKWYRQTVAQNGQAKVDQEFPSDEETCWLFDGRLFFDKDVLSRLRQDTCAPKSSKLAGAFRIWHEPLPDKKYVVSVDPSGGSGGDPAAAVILERETGRHCATLCGQFPPDVFGSHVAMIAWRYNRALVIVERSSSHAAVHAAMALWKRPKIDGSTGKAVPGYPDIYEGIGYPNVYVDSDRKHGFKINVGTRPAVLDTFEAAVRSGAFLTSDIELIKEAQLFIVKDEKPQAAPGAHDDQIMASAIGWFLLQIPLGLHHKVFAQAPSIAYANTPAAFENIVAANQPQSIDDIVKNEQRRWAGGGMTQTMSDGGFGAGAGPGDMDGF